jgi:hypothetical protein
MYSKTPWKVAAAVAVAGLIAIGFSSGAKATEVGGLNLDAQVAYVQNKMPDLYLQACPTGCPDPEVKFAPMPDGMLGATTLADPVVYINMLAEDDLARVIFVHEYVHYLQVLAHRYIPKVLAKADACALMGAELEAYRVGDEYAELMGVEIPYYPNQPHPILGYVEACAEASR